MHLFRAACAVVLSVSFCRAMDEQSFKKAVFSDQMQKALRDKIVVAADQYPKVIELYSGRVIATDWVVLRNSFSSIHWAGKRKRDEIGAFLSLLKQDPVILRVLAENMSPGLLPEHPAIKMRLNALLQSLQPTQQAVKDSYLRDYLKYGHVNDVAYVRSRRATKVKLMLDVLLFHPDCKSIAYELLESVSV